MKLVLTLHEELTRKVEASQAQVEHLEDKLSVLYPQLSVLHERTSTYARGPQPALMRQLKVVRQKIEALEGLLTDARERLANSEDRLKRTVRKETV